MDAGSRSSVGAGFDDDDGLSARRAVSSSLKELTVRVEREDGRKLQRQRQRWHGPAAKYAALEALRHRAASAQQDQ